ncbi:MAG: N,N-dimethylformamidase beta subunit family domain-containing protein, partial [Gammaproteobacteria bacterium]
MENRMPRRFTHLAMLFCASLLSTYGPQVAASCAAPANAIEAENCQLGNLSSEWDIGGVGDPSLQGFATEISVNRGATVFFKIDANATGAYRLDIYRMGYYGGRGARKVATVPDSVTLTQNQPNCFTNATTGLIDCGNWAVSASWAVPANATSGIYFARAVRTSTGGASHIVFIVRDDASTSDVLFQTADTTWQAYNNYGGNSLYTGSPAGRAYKVSYNRPFNTRTVDNGQDWVFNAEYPMVRWLEANGYDVSYSTGVDSDRRGALIRNHKLFLSVGHDEYWSNGQLASVEAARNAGVDLGFFSGNEVFWKTRWENSIDGSGTPYRTLVCYKETHANAKIDPLPNVWTGTWRDPRFSPPADGGRPENALTGTLFTVNAGATTSIRVPAEDGKMRFWRNTSIANLAAGATATLPFGTLGYEWDEDIDNGFRPAGLFHMSTAVVPNAPVLLDFGSTFGSGTATHHLTLYRHNSGALVFGSGTVQWSWGLDSNHDNGSAAADVRMRQATVNLFADMGVQPATLQSGLVPATASTDTTAPGSTISSPTNGSNVPQGSPVSISGTAADSGGGVVGGVEVSVDGGTTWFAATGRANWSFSWLPSASGNVTIRSRAVDDSGNLGTPSAGVSVTVGSGQPPGNCTGSSVWPATAVPANPTDPDTTPVELGVKFRSDVNGFVCGIRFYKSSANTGTHVGKLWSSSGTLLGTATFAGETASGWQQADFGTPVAVTGNTVYVASYHAPNGRYAADTGFFAAGGVDNAPLHALQDGVSGGNGVYVYGTGSFPSSTFQSTNYWVDVVFTTAAAPDTTPPTVTSTTPASGATGVSPGTTVTAVFSEAMDATTVNPSTVELRDAANGLVTATVTY